jgi:hypothetical protein
LPSVAETEIRPDRILPISLSHSTELATTVQNSQSLPLKDTVPNARCSQGR